MKRRGLLSTALAASVPLCGCLGVGHQGEGTEVELFVVNQTTAPVSVDVVVYSSDRSVLLDHSYSLSADDAGESADESRGVENRVEHVEVSVNGDEPVRHEYNPDLDIPCEGEDMVIEVRDEGIYFAYAC